MVCLRYFHALQLQYLADVRGPGVEHLCLARKLLLLAGFDFLMVIVGSPNRTVLTLPVLGLRTFTANFFALPGVLYGRFNLTISIASSCLLIWFWISSCSWP
jgi:hypothetical protein